MSDRSTVVSAREWREHKKLDTPVGFTVGVAASFTAEPIEAHLGMGLLDAGLTAPRFQFADYNQIHQLCLNPGAVLGGAVDHMLVLWRVEDVFATALEAYLGGSTSALAEIVDGVGELARMLATLGSEATLTVSVPPMPMPWGVDCLDSRVSSDLGHLHRQVLYAFTEPLQTAPTVSMLDLDSLLRSHGTAAAIDETKWALYRQPFTSGFWALLGSGAAEVVARQYQPAPKCVVLDCDNTLWGGVIGEDGLSGIQLGDTFPGSGFSTFQKRLLELRDAGVMLAISSKNDLAAVRDVFQRHDGMVLTESDIASWRVNWLPKSENIREIASELNIGLDSVVFVDDSSFELAEVETAVPEVIVLQVPEETSELPGLIGRSGLFRHLRVSEEDRKRTQMMLAEGSRRSERESMTTEEFLQSLQLRVNFFAPGQEHVARVAQLTNKTNQFNLTTVRCSEAEIAALIDSDRHEVRAIRVSDRFGDYGLVGVAIADRSATTWELDSFLMSCRVLGRGVESAFLASLLTDAAADDVDRVVGRYVATAKNGQVSDFYPRHGFSGSDGVYSLAIDDARSGPQHIEVVR